MYLFTRKGLLSPGAPKSLLNMKLRLSLSSTKNVFWQTSRQTPWNTMETAKNVIQRGSHLSLQLLANDTSKKNVGTKTTRAMYGIYSFWQFPSWFIVTVKVFAAEKLSVIDWLLPGWKKLTLTGFVGSTEHRVTWPLRRLLD